MSALTITLAIILGAASWTLTEYCLHRFLGHELKGAFRKFIFFKEHMKHHHKKDYFASTRDKLLTAYGIGPAVFTVTYFAVGSLFATVFTASFLAMYYVYEVIHRRLHVVAPKHSYAGKMRAHHFYHHFVDERMNHGVTTAFWDRVFGTYVKTNYIPIPKKFSLDWITELSSEKDFVDQYGNHYQSVEKFDPVTYAS